MLILSLITGIIRVIITARQTLVPVYEAILGKLIAILGIMAWNPRLLLLGELRFLLK